MVRTYYNKFILNPFTLYSLTWLLVLSTYNLGWGTLYPKLSWEYQLFFALTITFSTLIGYVTYKKQIFRYRPLRRIRVKLCRKVIILLLILFLIEIYFSGGIPILSYLRNAGDIKYTEFGLPFIHVIVVNGSMVCLWYSFYAIKSTAEKSIKKNCIFNIILSFLPFVLMFNRGGMLYCIAGCILLQLMAATNLKKHLALIGVFITFVLYIFGVLGNIRTDISDTKNLILEFGQATDEFKNSPIPKEFFWSYIYISSPLATAQNTANYYEGKELKDDAITKFILFELTPEIISKRIKPTGFEADPPKLIAPMFTVGSVYARSHTSIGWAGPITLYLFFIFFIIVTIGFIPKKSDFYILGIVAVCLVTIFNLFDNMFIFMGLIPVPLILILCSHIRIKKFPIFD